MFLGSYMITNPGRVTSDDRGRTRLGGVACDIRQPHYSKILAISIIDARQNILMAAFSTRALPGKTARTNARTFRIN